MLIDVTEIRMIERYLEALLLFCVCEMLMFAVYLGMVRFWWCWVQVVHRSKINFVFLFFFHKTVRTGALLTH